MPNHILTQDGKWVTLDDDELMHWKYIKREKKNGKWVYYYNNKEYQDLQKAKADKVDAVNQVSNARRERTRAAGNAAVTGYQLGQTGHRYLQPNSNAMKIHLDLNQENSGLGKRALDKYHNQYWNYKAQIQEADQKISWAKKNVSKASRNVDAAKKAYEKTAGAKVADLLTKSSDAVDKAKSWVSGLFSKKKNK